MPAFTPQSMLYRARGPMADGNAYRDRGAEQAYTYSGNPNMPIFNQPRMAPVAGGASTRPMTMPAVGSGDYLQHLRQMGSLNPLPYGASNGARAATVPMPQYNRLDADRWARQLQAQQTPSMLGNRIAANMSADAPAQFSGMQGALGAYAARGMPAPAPTKPAMLQRPAIPLFRGY